MKIGVPKEIKIGETRVSMTPSLCRRCVSLGAKVLVQKSAGVSAGFTDAEYRAAGATMVSDAKSVWKAADLILKVKEPLAAEYDLLQEGQALFTYLHLAAGPALAKVLLKKKILGISYETRSLIYVALLAWCCTGAIVLFIATLRAKRQPVSLRRVLVWTASIWVWPLLLWRTQRR